ncbi:MAG: 2Fe-2S ferredoxin [Bacillota bacterium]|nr:2Fe-2S ferredoxin [Bacillota bacterium]
MQKPKYHLFVCTSSRINGMQKGYCFSNDSVKIVNKIMEEIEDRDLEGEVMVTNTGCFGICNRGPIVVVYPEGVWYGAVTVNDVEEIFDSHIENGQKVERLEIK